MKVLHFLAALAVIATSATAEEATPVQRAAEKMFEDAFTYMGVAYICQDAIGAAYYHSARSIAEQVVRKAVKSDADAVVIVDDFDKRTRRENKKRAPAANYEKCMDTLMEAQTNSRVSRARFDKAVEASSPRK
ncbi:hypothetical protein [Kaistia sp. MMO-174]|uniref:hypothetical protein n=1 Tax=Kaistia sp. MMO-174 TaxID=3081256 RepID=UPI0030186A6A